MYFERLVVFSAFMSFSKEAKASEDKVLRSAESSPFVSASQCVFTTGVSVGALFVTATGVGVFTARTLSVFPLVVFPLIVDEALLLVPGPLLHASTNAATTIKKLHTIALRI